MKKFFADIDAGHYYESPFIKEVEYDHFDENSESTIIGYDGDISPKGRNRTENKNIRYSLFWKNSIYENYEDAKNFLKQKLEDEYNTIEPEYKKLRTQIINIETALKKI